MVSLARIGIYAIYPLVVLTAIIEGITQLF
jgi:hypothetical protein